MEGTFTLTITLGNDTMQTAEDVSERLRDIADILDREVTSGAILDTNGNKVGTFAIEED